jgi:1-acyl-sn-glycerol-3-phosphate acyltransferase
MSKDLINSLSHLWRVFATGFCFTLFGVGGIFLTLIILPLYRVFVACEIKRKYTARKCVHYCFKVFVATMHYLGVIHFTIEDKAQFANLNGQLVLANHPSLIDVVVLISIIKNADCVVKAHLFKNPFMRGVIKSTGYISNESPEGLLAQCEASLASGNNLILFPEGTRTDPSKPLNFKRGAANIVIRCRAPVTCALIEMKPSTLTKGTPWYQVAPIRPRFLIRLTSAKFKKNDDFNDESPSMQARYLTRQLQTFFSEELKRL